MFDGAKLISGNRCLSDREVCEAFGGGSPNLFRIGEENCTAEMFGGAAGKFGMQMSYKILYKGETPLTNSLVTTVNDSVAHTNNEVTGNLVSFKIEPEDGLFHDGENTIVLDFLQPTRTDGKTDWVSPDMIAIEPLKPKTGLVIILK